MITGGARVALQDSIRLPLKGETPKVRYERFIPRRPKTTMLIIGAFIGSTIYGIYNYRIGKSIRHELLREKLQSQLSLKPLLDAEEDIIKQWKKDNDEPYDL